MFNVTAVKQYDEHFSFGTDWCTDYYIQCDEQLTIDDAIARTRQLGYEPCGACTLVQIKNNSIDNYILKTRMY